MEAFVRQQLFCEEAIPCSVFMSESYKLFRMACCRVVEEGVRSSEQVSQSDAKKLSCATYLNNNWKLELVGNTVYVLRIESKVLPDNIVSGIRKRAALEEDEVQFMIASELVFIEFIELHFTMKTT